VVTTAMKSAAREMHERYRRLAQVFAGDPATQQNDIRGTALGRRLLVRRRPELFVDLNEDQTVADPATAVAEYPGLAEGLGLNADRPGVDLAADTSLHESGLRHGDRFSRTRQQARRRLENIHPRQPSAVATQCQPSSEDSRMRTRSQSRWTLPITTPSWSPRHHENATVFGGGNYLPAP
jgi:hypothetical protein